MIKFIYSFNKKIKINFVYFFSLQERDTKYIFKKKVCYILLIKYLKIKV